MSLIEESHAMHDYFLDIREETEAKQEILDDLMLELADCGVVSRLLLLLLFNNFSHIFHSSNILISDLTFPSHLVLIPFDLSHLATTRALATSPA